MRGPRTRWCSLVALAVVVALSPAAPAAAQLSEYLPPRAEPEVVDAGLLQRWLETVERHEPGVLDAATLGAAHWNARDLRRLYVDIQVLIRLSSAPKTKRFRVTPAPTPSGRWREAPAASFARPSDRAIVEELAGRIRVAGLAPMLKRAALVHTDVTTLAPGIAPAVGGDVTLVGDGQRAGSAGISLHWPLARMLLDHLPPHPREHPFVRDWYRATVATAQRTEFWDAEHLRHGLELFPADPLLLLLKGAQHEAFAAPLYQAVMRGFTGQRIRPDIDDTGAELGRAEKAFRAALAADPSLVEARIRLGRVLALKGERDAAMRELERALADGPEPTLEYYARVFLGAEHQSVGTLTAARAQFLRAAALEPNGRVPYLALAQIAGELGDREEMQAALDRALAPLARESAAELWWSYRASQARRADAWLGAVRRSWSSGTP